MEQVLAGQLHGSFPSRLMTAAITATAQVFPVVAELATANAAVLN